MCHSLVVLVSWGGAVEEVVAIRTFTQLVEQYQQPLRCPRTSLRPQQNSILHLELSIRHAPTPALPVSVILNDVRMHMFQGRHFQWATCRPPKGAPYLWFEHIASSHTQVASATIARSFTSPSPNTTLRDNGVTPTAQAPIEVAAPPNGSTAAKPVTILLFRVYSSNRR